MTDKKPEPLMRADELDDIGALSNTAREMASLTIRLLYKENEELRAKLNEPTIDGWPLWSGLPQRNLQKIRQAAWKDVRSEYKDDPECCFAMGFDAGYDAVAQRVEPPIKESGEGFESLPASPQREWVGLTDKEIEQAAQGGDTNFWDFCRIIEAKLKEKNNG